MPQLFRGRSASSRTATRPGRVALAVTLGLVGLTSSHAAVTTPSEITIHGSDTMLVLNREFAAAHAKRDPSVNLGHALKARRLYPRADLCFDTFQRVERDPAIARGINEARRSRR